MTFVIYLSQFSEKLILYRKRDAQDQMEKALRTLGKEEFHLLLEYVRDWNTKPKLCLVAQFVLSRVFSIVPPTELLEVSKYTVLVNVELQIIDEYRT